MILGERGRSIQSFYDEQADSYDDVMALTSINWLYRRAFWRLVDARIPPASSVLDVGCGTGQDAQHFAGEGHRVIAYDLSPRMIAVLAQRCRAAVDAGCVVPVSGPPDELHHALTTFGPIHAVVANFAVVNLMRDLTEIGSRLVRTFPECVWVVLAVQNPFWFADMRSAWWWQGLARSREIGAIAQEQGYAPPTYRHFVPRIRAAIGDAFELDAQWSLFGRRLVTRFPGNRGGHLRLLALRRR